MRKEASVKDKVGKGDTRTRPRMSRAQLLALLVGTFQVAATLVPVLPLAAGNHALHVCTGLVGMVLAWKHEYARLYGVALLLIYGKLYVDEAGAATSWLQLPTLETLAYGRAALMGLVIALVPAFTRR